MLKGLPNADGYDVGRHRVVTLMKRMRVEAQYRRANTSKRAPGHEVCPDLLRQLKDTLPDQVWAMDVPRLPMGRGVVSLAAVIAGTAAWSWRGGSRSR